VNTQDGTVVGMHVVALGGGLGGDGGPRSRFHASLASFPDLQCCGIGFPVQSAADARSMLSEGPKK
jgi:hypothetical protein